MAAEICGAWPVTISALMDAVLETLSTHLKSYDNRLAALEARSIAARDGRDGLPGRDGVDGQRGADGADGVGFDDLSVEYDGDRTVTVKAVSGERVKAFPITLPMVIYRGVWREADTYTKGDAVTADGSMWIARETPTGKPGTMASGWQLAVKRGTK
jgi:hypothetical protein